MTLGIDGSSGAGLASLKSTARSGKGRSEAVARAATR